MKDRLGEFSIGRLSLRLLGFVAISLFLSALPEQGLTLSIEVPLEKIVVECDAIVVGKVLSSKSYRRELIGQDKYGVVVYQEIVTDFRIQVREVLKGENIGHLFTITSQGGRIGEKGQWSSYSFDIREGTNVVLFASFDSENDVWWGYEQSTGVFEANEVGPETFLEAVSETALVSDGKVISRQEYMAKRKAQYTLSNVRRIVEGGK